MSTLDDIKATHSKVKSGADFPAYVRDMKALGVISYEHYVSDGHVVYHGIDDQMISSDAKWQARGIATYANEEALKGHLQIHQAGQTDYPTFCRQAAEDGIEKWVVDMIKMKCIYFDKENTEVLIETIPTV